MGTPLEKPSASVPLRDESHTGSLDQLSLKFNESMAGFLAVGETLSAHPAGLLSQSSTCFCPQQLPLEVSGQILQVCYSQVKIVLKWSSAGGRIECLGEAPDPESNHARGSASSPMRGGLSAWRRRKTRV
jgi:hypothetical protein